MPERATTRLQSKGDGKATREIAAHRCFESHFITLFQASWLSFEAFTSLMRIGFLYYNCLGFGLASDYTDVVLNTVQYIVGVRI